MSNNQSWLKRLMNLGMLLIMAIPNISSAQNTWDEIYINAQSAHRKGDIDATLDLLKQAQPLACNQSQKIDERCALTLDAIGKVYLDKGLASQAAPYLLDSYQYTLSKLGQYHWKTLLSCGNLGSVLQQSGRGIEAEKVLTPCVEEKNDVDVINQVNEGVPNFV